MHETEQASMIARRTSSMLSVFSERVAEEPFSTATRWIAAPLVAQQENRHL
jgi:hypothetical protein